MSWCLRIQEIPGNIAGPSFDRFYSSFPPEVWQQSISEKALYAFHHCDLPGVTEHHKDVVVECVRRSMAEKGITRKTEQGVRSLRCAPPLWGDYVSATWFGDEMERFDDVPEGERMAWATTQRLASRNMREAFCASSITLGFWSGVQSLDKCIAARMGGPGSGTLDVEVVRCIASMEADFRFPCNAVILVSALCAHICDEADRNGQQAAESAARKVDPAWLFCFPIYRGRYRKAYMRACSVFASCRLLPHAAMLRYILMAASRTRSVCAPVADLWCAAALAHSPIMAQLKQHVPSASDMRELAPGPGPSFSHSPSDDCPDNHCSDAFARTYAELCASPLAGRVLARVSLPFVLGTELATKLCTAPWHSREWVDCAASCNILPVAERTRAWRADKHLPLYAVASCASELVEILKAEEAIVARTFNAFAALAMHCPSQFILTPRLTRSYTPYEHVDAQLSDEIIEIFTFARSVANAKDAITVCKEIIMRNPRLEKEFVKTVGIFFLDSLLFATARLCTESSEAFVTGCSAAMLRAEMCGGGGSGGDGEDEGETREEEEEEEEDMDSLLADMISCRVASKTEAFSVWKDLISEASRAGFSYKPSDAEITFRAMEVLATCSMRDSAEGRIVIVTDEGSRRVELRPHRAACRAFRRVLQQVIGTIPTPDQMVKSCRKISNVGWFRAVHSALIDA